MTAMTPQRIQRRRTKGWRLPDGTVVVSRPTRWGNPIALAAGARQYPSLDEIEVAGLVVLDFAVLAARGSLSFPNWLFADGHRGPVTWTYPALADIRGELAGKNLACWCPIVDADGRPVPCHADVLLSIARGDAP